MNTVAANTGDYDLGLMTRDGYFALRDAETYVQVTSVSACSSSRARLFRHLAQGPLQLFDPIGISHTVTDMDAFRAWAHAHFPHALDYLDRSGR